MPKATQITHWRQRRSLRHKRGGRAGFRVASIILLILLLIGFFFIITTVLGTTAVPPPPFIPIAKTKCRDNSEQNLAVVSARSV